MPEGPSIVLLKEAVASFKGLRVTEATGNTHKIDPDLLIGNKITDFKSWGKHFLICFEAFFVRIHFMLFGTYRINEHKDSPARLHLGFGEKELNFYACSVEMLLEDPELIYDWSADVMSDKWDRDKAFEKLKMQPELLVCDALLDQQIFSGVGNIIKNEVLYRIAIHPKSIVGKIPELKLREMIDQARIYSFDFLEWKREYTLKKHWLVHTKAGCPAGHGKLLKEYLGKTNRRTYFCEECQELYD